MLNAESSMVFERTIDSRKSIVAKIGEANSATEIIHQKITRVAIPKRYVTPFHVTLLFPISH